MDKVVLAYSGGLDTTAVIPWLKETYGYEVICCCIDCGQGEELDGLEERARLSGAAKLYIEDVVDDLCENYIMPCVKAGAVYEHKYLMGTAMARPTIAAKLVEIARKEDAVAICHGATGKGNDQIRFELGIKALAPDIKVIAPWRDDRWQMDSRQAEIDYCKAHGIDLPFGTDQSYSRDRNIWHISHEGLELEDPSQAPNYDHMLVLGVTPEKAPAEAETGRKDSESRRKPKRCGPFRLPPRGRPASGRRRGSRPGTRRRTCPAGTRSCAWRFRSVPPSGRRWGSP